MNRIKNSLASIMFMSAFTGSAHAQNDDLALWKAYSTTYQSAKYIDLTHAFEPNMTVWPGFGNAKFKPAVAGKTVEGFVKQGEEFTYKQHGFVATAYELPTDQYGTQLDPPAHWNPMGATISDIPATFSVRPLVVINIAPKVEKDPGYHLQVQDIKDWEAQHGRIPEGAVVMVRSDWYKRWNDQDRYRTAPFPGVSLAALKFLHIQRKIMLHGHEPLDTDTTPNLEGEAWLMKNNFAQAEGVANLDKVPEAGALISIGFAKPLGGTGGYARYIAIAPQSWKYGEIISQAPGAPLPTQKHPLERDKDGVMRPAP